MLYDAQRTVYEQEHLDSEPFLGNMWANINPPGGMNRAHHTSKLIVVWCVLCKSS
jgi:hypothetical protein